MSLLKAIGKLTACNEQVAEYRDKVIKPMAEGGYLTVDEEIRHIVEKYNRFPGIATTDCCASHPERKNSIGQSDDQFYIAALVSEEGFEILTEIYFELTAKIVNHPIIFPLVSHLYLRHRMRMISTQYRHWGNIWTITTHAESADVKAMLVTCFNEAVDNVIRNHERGSLGDPS